MIIMKSLNDVGLVEKSSRIALTCAIIFYNIYIILNNNNNDNNEVLERRGARREVVQDRLDLRNNIL